MIPGIYSPAARLFENISVESRLQQSFILKASIILHLCLSECRRYPAQTIMDADYADGIVLLENTPAQAETLLDSLERAAAGIGLHVKVHKMEYMCFNQRGDISTQNGGSL